MLLFRRFKEEEEDDDDDEAAVAEDTGEEEKEASTEAEERNDPESPPFKGIDKPSPPDIVAFEEAARGRRNIQQMC